MLFSRLRLPVATSLADEMAASRRRRNGRLGGFGLSSRPPSRPTNNAALNQLTHLHPLPRIVMEWRRVNALLEKTFAPLVASCLTATQRHSQVRWCESIV